MKKTGCTDNIFTINAIISAAFDWIQVVPDNIKGLLTFLKE